MPATNASGSQVQAQPGWRFKRALNLPLPTWTVGRYGADRSLNRSQSRVGISSDALTSLAVISNRAGATTSRIVSLSQVEQVGGSKWFLPLVCSSAQKRPTGHCRSRGATAVCCCSETETSSPHKHLFSLVAGAAERDTCCCCDCRTHLRRKST